MAPHQGSATGYTAYAEPIANELYLELAKIQGVPKFREIS